MVADPHLPGQHPHRGRPALAAVPAPRTSADRASWQRVVTDGLEARGYVTALRGDHAEFRCPVHEDTKASGTADYVQADGKTLIHCHRECDTAEILAAVGCKLADLYDAPGERTPPRPEECGHKWRDVPPEAKHLYARPDGELVNTVVRKRCPRCGVKDIRPARPWPMADRILYRLPEVADAIAHGSAIYVVEGEKCADAVAATGFAATTNPFGAGKWLDSYTDALRGAAYVVIVADNDLAGYEHAADVAARLTAAGIEHEVTRGAVDRLKADVADHLEAGHALADLVQVDPAAELAQIRGELADVAGGTREPAIPAPFRRRLELADGVTAPAGQRIPVDPMQLPDDISLLDARRYDPGDWPHIVPSLLPVGAIVVYGRPGVAKTTLSAQLEHCIAAGLPIAGYAPDAPGRCLVIDFEGGPMLAIGQSLRIAPFGSLPTDDGGDPDDMISVRTAWPGDSFAERFAALEKELRDADYEGRPYRLVRIDTMRAFMGSAPLGVNSYQWDADCLIAVNRLAREMHAAIILIHHPNKAGEVSGSVGIEGSVTAAYRLERKAGEYEGVLRATKNRVGPETNWAVEFSATAGTWQFSDEITVAQASNTGVKRAIIDLLTASGPTAGPEIRAALSSTRDRTVRDMITRLSHDGWVTRTPDGLWALTAAAAPHPAPAPSQAGPAPSPAAPAAAAAAAPDHRPRPRPAGTCEACGTAMTVLTDSQRWHPLCEPDPAPEPREPAPSYVTPPPADDPGPQEHGDAGEADPVWSAGPDTCPACGEPLTNADQHPDCAQDTGPVVKWPGTQVMRESIATSRMKPVPWIPPAGHKQAKPGMQTRDLPQWRAAEQVDTGAFAWRLPGLDQLDGERLVVTLDRNMSYPSACSSVPVAPNTLKAVALTENPKTAGLAGVARIIVPEWPRADLPHPLGRNAVPGQPLVIPSGSLEELWVLHEAGLIGEPEVTGAFMGRRNTSLFEPFYKAVTAARARHAADPAMTLAIKRSSSIAVRLLYPKQVSSRWWRADWYGALVGQAMIRHWIRGRQAVDAGAVLVGLGSVDEAAFLVPADVDPAAWVPEPYKAGTGPGQVKRKRITVRANTVGLDAVDPAAMHPSPRGEDWTELAGAVPLKIWRQRRG